MSDALVKYRQMARFWCIRNQTQELLLKYHLYHNEWENNIVVRAEAIMLLELIETIDKKGRGTASGRIIISIDNRFVYHRIVK